MNSAGDSDIPGNDSGMQAGGDDGFDGGDFDLSGFADESPEGQDKPAGERNSSAKAPGAKAPYGKGPRAGGPDKAQRAAGPGPRAGGYDRPKAPGRGPRAYGDRGPRDGGYPGGKFERGSRAGGARDEGFKVRGPRTGGDRPAGGYGDRGPRAGGGHSAGGFRKEYGDRPQGRSFGPRGDQGERPRRFAPRPGAPGAEAPRGGDVPAFKPVSPEVKPWLSLKQDKGRWKESRFLLEGAKNVADALAASSGIVHEVFVAEDFKDKDLLAALKKNRIKAVTVTADDIRALSETETPQGIIAVCNFATLRPDWNVARYVTILDAVQDPGNVGAIFRTSAALGMDALVLGKGSCDPYNPKVVRSSVGALLGMPFETGEELGSKINFLRQKGFSVVATSSHAKQTLEQAKLRKKVALIVGNEGAGSGASYLDMADAVVKIPLKSKVESLNVAVAHGILSYQLIHGRE